jgi:Uma2 family endonuclease
MTAPAAKRLSYADYLALEAETHRKHEFDSGVVTMMVGGSRDHSLIAANLTRLLGNSLIGRPCRTFQSDHKIWIGLFDCAFYPDASVVCGPTIPAAHDPIATTNPSLVGEVLSPGTRGRDVTTKLIRYKSLPSVKHVVFIDSEAVLVMCHSREADGTWRATELFELPDHLTLHLHGDLDLHLADLYAGAEFLEVAPDAADAPDSNGPLSHEHPA